MTCNQKLNEQSIDWTTKSPGNCCSNILKAAGKDILITGETVAKGIRHWPRPSATCAHVNNLTASGWITLILGPSGFSSNAVIRFWELGLCLNIKGSLGCPYVNDMREARKKSVAHSNQITIELIWFLLKINCPFVVLMCTLECPFPIYLVLLCLNEAKQSHKSNSSTWEPPGSSTPLPDLIAKNGSSHVLGFRGVVSVQ